MIFTAEFWFDAALFFAAMVCTVGAVRELLRMLREHNDKKTERAIARRYQKKEALGSGNSPSA